MTYISVENKLMADDAFSVSCITMIIASLKEDDYVSEALSDITRSRRSNSLANNSGSYPRIRQKPWAGHLRSGGDAKNTDRDSIRFDYCINNLGNPQHLRSSWTQSCKVTSKFHVDG